MRKTLSVLGRVYTETGILDRRLTNPFEFSIFGMFQRAICCFLFLVLFYVSFSTTTEIEAKFHEPSCSEPENVQDYCSEECVIIKYFKDVDYVNYITEFGWICKSGVILDYMNLLDMFGYIFGAIFSCCAANKFGRKYTLIVGLGLGIFFESLLLLVKNEYVVIMNSFVIPFYDIAIRLSSSTMVCEIMPTRYLNVLITIIYVGENVGIMFAFVIWRVFRNWYWCFVSKFCITILLCCIVSCLTESPRWTFAHDNVTKTIVSLERIARINNETTDGIRDKVEKSWRLTRSIPKARDTFFGLFYYPFLRKALFKIICTSLAFFIINSVGYEESPETLLPFHWLHNSFLTKFFNPLLEIVTTIVWCFTSRNCSRRITIFCGYLLCSLLLLTLLLIRNTLGAWFIGKLIIINILFVGLHVEMFILEIFPTSVRAIILAMENILKKLGYKSIGMAYGNHHSEWLPIGIAFVVSLVIAGITSDLVDTSGAIMPITSRDAEIFIRTKKLGRKKMMNE